MRGSANADGVAHRSGVLPGLFGGAGEGASAWRFVGRGYLDNPLPPDFKTRLFIQLAQFCEARDCVVHHVGFLLGLAAGGDPAAPSTEMIRAALALGRAVPDAPALEGALLRLEAQRQRRAWLQRDSAAEADLFAALAVILLQPGARRACAAVRRAVGDAHFEALAALLALVRTAHDWLQMHPQLINEPDVAALAQRDAQVAQLLRDHEHRGSVDPSAQLSRALAHHEGRRAVFRLSLADALRPLVEPQAIQAEISRALGVYLGADRVFYAEMADDGTVLIRAEYGTAGMRSMAGHHVLADFGAAAEATLRSGRTLVCADVSAWSALTAPERAACAGQQIASTVKVPLVKAGRLSAFLAVHQAQPRDWNAADLALMEETAQRAWAAVERGRAEKALRATQERFRVLVENVRDHAILTVDPRGCIDTWNPGAQHIFGYAPEEIMGRDASLLFTAEDRERGVLTQLLQTAAQTGHVAGDRWQMRKNGERFWASGVTSAMRSGDGTLRGFTKVLRDDTGAKLLAEQRERLLEQEQAAVRQAQQAVVMKDEFIAVVSHELRSPLSAILMWARLLRDGRIQGQQQHDGLESIVRSAEAQRQLIEDLLDVSRMMSGQLRLNMREVELAPIIRAAVDAVRLTAAAREIAIHVAAQDVGTVRADPDRIQQVVWNLVNNAVKFTEAGGRVDVQLQQGEGSVRICVADTGRGIAPDFLAHVFERFRQADASSTRLHGGLGLGLAISRQLVQLHGGSIQAESAGVGRGATFTVTLPLAVPAHDTPARQRVAAVGDTAPATQRLRGLRVLLVEDEPETRTAIQLALRQGAADVTAVASAAAAMTVFQGALDSARYDLLVSDVGMPGHNGYELIAWIRQLERRHGTLRGIAAVALTAYARAEDRQQALAAGFQLHLAKPVDPAVLVEALSRLADANAR